MATRSDVYRGAAVEMRDERILLIGPDAGKTCVHVLYAGRKSHGARSGYETVPCRWLVILIDGKRWGAWTYTGKRYAQGMADYLHSISELDAHNLAQG